ncbi:hypothetical protein NHX12_010889, partial [Muraenolepis orangiensis]
NLNCSLNVTSSEERDISQYAELSHTCQRLLKAGGASTRGTSVEMQPPPRKLKSTAHSSEKLLETSAVPRMSEQKEARRTEHGIFYFRTGLQKMSTKLSSRLKDCDDRLHEVRNEYLLSLAAVNAHLHHYYTAQLPHIMERMDGDVYDQLRGHFTLLCDTEMSVTRERNVQHFLQEALSFSTTPPRLAFQPNVCDVVNVLQEVCDAGGESALKKEARKWANKVAKDYKIISHGTRALQSLESRVELLPKETGLSVEQRMAE